MIILSEKQTKLLIPVKKSEWRSSSQKLNFYDVGEDKTVFRLQAKLNDGHIKWTGIFEDRDDADEFLYAMAKETLKYDKFLWSLCFPNWNPDIGENLIYEFATITYRTTTGAGTFTVPSDWNNNNNKIEVIGGGGGGGTGYLETNPELSAGAGGAAGGGAYSVKNNVTLTRGSSLNCSVGTGGAIATAGGDTWIRTDGGAASAPTSVAQGCLAKGGARGVTATDSNPGAAGAGGAAASGYGDTKYSGGSGGQSYSAFGMGGGGAGGPNGNGASGGYSVYNTASGGGGNGGGYTGGVSTTSNGGNGGNNYLNTGGGNGGTGQAVAVAGTNGGGGGAGSFTYPTGAKGGNGIEWDSTHGSGGGGGGGSSGLNRDNLNAGGGGLYGGGGAGGGGGNSTGLGGTGAQGIIVATYEPVKISGFNMPMLGM